MAKISIAIPTYEYGGYGRECLEYSFKQIENQTFKDFNVIISDSSDNEDIENLCKTWNNKFEIIYEKSPCAKGNPAKNMTLATSFSTGEWVKILCQDDYLTYNTSLQTIANALDEKHSWLATGYLHTYDRESFFNYHSPYLNPRIYIINTIGTPSCTVFKREDLIQLQGFDDKLSYAYDCEFYYRYYKAFGNPKMITDVTIVNYLWEKSISSGITNEFIEKENKYILRKHGFLNE